MKSLNNKGFTLVEMLMVLAIVTLVFYISSMNFLKTKNQLGLVEDIEVLAQAYQSLQLNSLTLNSESSIKVYENGFSCFIQKEEVCSYSYNNTYELTSNFLDNTISINDDGNVIMGGTIAYKYNDFQKELVITIGSGRYEIR